MYIARSAVWHVYVGQDITSGAGNCKFFVTLPGPAERVAELPMAASRAYLDHNASSPVRPEVAAAVAETLARGGNPSSVHAEGRAARALVERAREQVAGLVGARPEGVIFTSGGTEANGIALRPGALAFAEGRPVRRLVFARTEHASIVGGHGFDAASAHPVDVDAEGRIDLAWLGEALDRHGGEPLLLSLQVANSETGVVQPVAEAAALVRAYGGAIHSDAVQAAGRVPVDMAALGLDAVSLSGHKLGGPAGTGALVIAQGRDGPNLAWMRGGGQESGRRAGTENLAGIVGFGKAAEIAVRSLESQALRLAALRDFAEAEIRRLAPEAVIFGVAAQRLPNTVAFAVPGVSAETALMALDLDGVAVSSGSACSSGKVARSHVLAAMGVPDDLARGAIRVSFGWNSDAQDVMRFARAFETLLQRLYERGRARAA